MTEIKFTCPHCGHDLYFIINENEELALRSFDICDGSETVKLLREYGYELGTVTAEGGEKSDE